jgi:transcriptional regulator with XRE-family HTH domain
MIRLLGDKNYMTEINKLRLLRSKKYWTLEELSQRSGVSLSAILSIEYGNTTSRLGTLCKLADALGCPLEELLPFLKKDTLATGKKSLNSKKSPMLPTGEIIEHVKTPSERELETREAAKQRHQTQLVSALEYYREGYTSSRTLSEKMQNGKSTASMLLRELRANGSIT